MNDRDELHSTIDAWAGSDADNGTWASLADTILNSHWLRNRNARTARAALERVNASRGGDIEQEYIDAAINTITQGEHQ